MKIYTFIGNDCPPGYRRVGRIDVADPADVHRAEDQGYRIGTIYDGRSYSCAEPCAADIYELDMQACERCQGNGEIVTDWERYRHPHAGDVGDEAVAECPDCGGEGIIDAPSPVPNLRAKPLEWRRGYCDDQVTISQATSLGGIYQVRVLNGAVWLDKPCLSKEAFPSTEEAIAAAQADHERRILDCLEGSYPAPPQPNMEALEEIKYLALTAGAPGHTPVPKALARMIFLCNRAGITKKLDDLRPQFAASTEGLIDA